MIPKNILKKIRDIEITARKLSTSSLTGKHMSVFKGTGIDFSDMREYTIGDDIRNIAWRQSAKGAKTYIKNYSEDRNLNILLFIDVSPSGNFGSWKKFNAEAACEFAATIAMSAMKSGDKVGLALASDGIDLYIPFGKGQRHILRIIREIIYFQPKSQLTNLRKSFKKLNLLTPKHSQVLLFTDIYSDLKFPELKVFSKKHDLNVITIFDSLEKNFPDIGNIELNDLETGKNTIINTSSKKFRKSYAKNINNLFEDRKRFLTKNAIPNITINNNGNILMEIIKFYSLRRQYV